MPATSTLPHLWGVLRLFLIPIGGGIPAGVLLARDYGLGWPIMAGLYLISDIALAFVFEPMILFFVMLSRRSSRVAKFNDVMKKSIQKTMALYSENPRPLALVMISFGTDPMTGRGVTAVAGHGIVFGWMIAIAGDMLYFGLILACTLWLKEILGDGTYVEVTVLAFMFLGPWAFRRAKKIIFGVKHERK